MLGKHDDIVTSPDTTSPRGRLRLITLGGLALLDEAGRPVTALGPRNLALLAYLALATKPLTRDHVAELFWGDRDEDRARHSMREALSKLRQVLGPAAIARRSDRVMLEPSVNLSVDAKALAAASSAGDAATVVSLYAGPFLDGVHTGGARSFEDWGDAERSMYEARFVAACASECARLRTVSPVACAELARRWLHAAPLDPKAAIELLRALAAPDTQDALRVATREYHAIAERLANDFELAPHASVTAVADRIAHRSASLAAELSAIEPPVEETPKPGEVQVPAPVSAPIASVQAPRAPATVPPATHVTELPVAASPVMPVVPVAGSASLNRSWITHSRVRNIAIAAVLLLAVAAGFAVVRSRESAAVSGIDTIAILPFDVVSGASDGWLAAGTPRLIGASLSRENVVGVVDAAHIRDALASRDTTAAPSSAAAIAAARTVGARWMLRGSVIAGAGRFWLDMRLSDVHSGNVLRRITVSDSTIDATVARGTAQIVASIDAPMGAQLVEFEPKSVNGYRAYIRAEQLHAQRRDDEAAATLDGAIASDSGFVAAIIERRFLLGMPSTPGRMDSARALEAAYMRARPHASDFERLYFDAYLALHNGDHERAESESRKLMERYPADPRAYSSAFGILVLHGKFAEASLLGARAIALDSAGNALSADECRVCIGYTTLSEIARITGNLPRAEAMARRSTTLGPDNASAWWQLATVLSAEGRTAGALAAGRRAGGLAPTDPEFAMMPIQVLLEAREYSAADSALQVWTSVTDKRFALHAADLRFMVLRERGQFQAAARLATSMLGRFPADSNWLLLVQGETLARIGDVAGTKRVFTASVSGWPRLGAANGVSSYSGDRARSNTWPRAILADVLWQAGAIDGASLSALADSIQATGAESYYARDWRLYHHVRGLIAMNARRWSEADSEFAQASWEHAGWSRSLVERAHAQIEEHHSADAIRTLREAYALPLAAMSRYVPRSELDYEMARAFVAAGMTDSARVYALRASSAWKTADPAVRKRLSQLPPSVL